CIASSRSSLPLTGPSSPALRRLRALCNRDEPAQDRGGALQAILRILPLVEEHHLLVGPHARVPALLADEGDQPLWIGEDVVAERHPRALGAGPDLPHVGAPA